MKKSFSSGQLFPDCWQVGDTVYVSGQVAIDAEGAIVGVGDIEQQTRTTYENLENVLAKAGCTLGDLVKINTFIVFKGPENEFSDYWERMNRARKPYIDRCRPTATAIRVAGLAHPDFLIEIDGIAVLDLES